MSTDFVHLHVHSEYSLLDGLGRIPELVRQAVTNKQTALALTDHGVMHGAVEFFRECKKHDIKPIIGVEAYMTLYNRKMSDREPQRDKARHHLLLLAKNQTGYQNLLKVCAASQLEGYYYKPRIDADFLASHSEGLICTTGCMAGEVPYWLNSKDRKPNRELALERLHWYLDIFGKENFFVELQEHSIPELQKINKTLLEWSKKEDLQLLVTNDAHYARQEDARLHETLLCVQTSSLVSNPKMKLSDNSYYLKTRAELEATFRPFIDLPASAFSNSLQIAEMCEVSLEDDQFHLPHPAHVMRKYPEHDYQSLLKLLTTEGLKRRYDGRDGRKRFDDPEVLARKELELDIINTMNFDVYFLIVWDMCQYAEQENIWWNVRGSGAGSIVAYALGITMVDPLKHNLIFERFLNPGRISMPDFDLDYPDDQREQMIRYTIETYGEDQVAQIVSFGRMKARAAIRDVGRAYDVELSDVNRVAKLIPSMPGVKIDNTLEKGNKFYSRKLHQIYESDASIKRLVDTARDLEGIARHSSVHAAAVIITDKPLVNYLPLMRPQGSVITKSITQFEYPICESIGLLKVDFLGLSTLTVMRKAVALIKQRHGIDYTLNNIPTDDPKSFELLASGNVSGVFQVESDGMRRILIDMKPNTLENIIAVVALYRPGPLQYIPNYIARMHGKEEFEYHHPDLEPILAETYGIIVFQEQIMRIATELAGYTNSEADFMRKAVSKKKKKALLKHRKLMVDGGKKKGIPEKVMLQIFDDIEYFARYGFNKSHATDYAVITCQTAYLKANYPVEYMTALLTVEHNNTEKVGSLMDECRSMGIEVLPPDINTSLRGFSIENENIRFGLGAIKNVGDGPIEAITLASNKKIFDDLDDFCQRVELKKVGKRALESLLKAGTLDQFGNREQMLQILDTMITISRQIHQPNQNQFQTSMFVTSKVDVSYASLYPLPDVEDVENRKKLEWEKELVGTYITSHPVQSYLQNNQLPPYIFLCSDVANKKPNGKRIIKLIGLVADVRYITTKNGKQMAVMQLEDMLGNLDVTIFPQAFSKFKQFLTPGKIVYVVGRIDTKNPEPVRIIADRISNELPANGNSNNNHINGHAINGRTAHGNNHQVVAERNGSYDIPSINGYSTPSRQHNSNNEKTPPEIIIEPILFRRSGDSAQDKEKLYHLCEILKTHTGNETFYLYIPVPISGQTAKIEFSIKKSTELKSSLDVFRS
ncbi:MAG: DNA polymerase III subunit alpha [Anaerolineaceae bacterium 4572_78]|nr:MAG: DNA polymerase III subunit alpha [Anaerolineaceae bacterium 4572_78]